MEALSEREVRKRAIRTTREIEGFLSQFFSKSRIQAAQQVESSNIKNELMINPERMNDSIANLSIIVLLKTRDIQTLSEHTSKTLKSF